MKPDSSINAESFPRFQIDAYSLDGPFKESVSTFLAFNKEDRSENYILKKIRFTAKSTRQEYVNRLHQILSCSTPKLSKPSSICLSSPDDYSYFLSIISTRHDSSLSSEIDMRRNQRNYFSSLEMRCIIENTFTQLYRLSMEQLHHLNIKPTNILKTARGDYSLSEAGYPSLVDCLDNDVFRAPEFHSFLKNGNPIHSLEPLMQEYADIFSLGLVFIQAATLLPTQDFKVFNDEQGLPQGAEDILNQVQVRYGKEMFGLLMVMVAFDESKRFNLTDLKEKQLKILKESSETIFGGGSHELDSQMLPPAPEDQAAMKKIKHLCIQFCAKNSQTLQDYFERSQGYDPITKTLTKYEFKLETEKMGISITDTELRSLNKVLDPTNTGKYFMKEFFRDSIQTINANTSRTPIDKQANTQINKFDDLPSLSSKEEEEQLQAALKRAFKFIKQEGIRLEKLFKDEDREATGELTFDRFKSVLQSKSITFRDSEFDLITVKFDLSFEKKSVHYLKFLNSLEKSIMIGDSELKDQLIGIFETIFKQHTSFSDFMSKYMREGESYVTVVAFLTFLEQEGVIINENTKNKLKQILDPSESGFFYLSNLKDIFKNAVINLVKHLVQDLIYKLEKKNLTFSSFSTTYLPKSAVVKINYIIEKLTEVIRCPFSANEIGFMLEYFELVQENKRAEDVNKNKLKECLTEFAKLNNLVYYAQVFGEAGDLQNIKAKAKNPSSQKISNTPNYKKTEEGSFSFSNIIGQIREVAKSMKRQDILRFYGLVDRKQVDLPIKAFSEKVELFAKLEESEINILFNQLAKNINNLRIVDATEFLGLLDVKTYDESEIKRTELVGGFNPNEVQKYSSIFIEINRLLTEKRLKAKDHFYSPESVVSRRFIEDKLLDLRFKVSDFEREIDMIFQQISGRIDRIELGKFVELILHFAGIAEDKEKLILNKSSIIWFIKIYKAMKEDNFPMNVFNRIISGGDRIRVEQFKQIIERDLRLKIDDNFSIFLDSISVPSGDISYNKFEEGYAKEEKAMQALSDMRNMTKSSNKVISSAFSNIDINGDGIISKQEFLEMMPIINTSLRANDLDYLYERLDLNNSGTISLDEFRDNILGKDALRNQQDFDKSMRDVYGEIQECVHRERKTFSDLFLSGTDKQMNISEFEKILQRIGFRIASREKMDLVFEDLSFGGVNFNKMRLKKKYSEFCDSKREENYERQMNRGGGGSQEKEEALEFTRMIKKAISSKRQYFDDIFGKRRSFRKTEFADLLLDRLEINVKRYQSSYDSFWDHFKDGHNNEIDLRLFQQVFNQSDDTQQNRSGANRNRRDDEDDQHNRNPRGGDGSSNLDDFLEQHTDDCNDEFERLHGSLITINEFMDSLKRVGYKGSLNKRDLEDYCDRKKCLNRNREVEYPTLLEGIRKSKRHNDSRSRRNDDQDDRRTRKNDNDDDRRNRRNDDDEDDRRNRRSDNDDYRNNRSMNDSKRQNRRDDSDRNDTRRRRGSSEERFNDKNREDNRDNRNNQNRGNQSGKQQRFEKKDYSQAIEALLDDLIIKKITIIDIIQSGQLDRNREGSADESRFWEQVESKRIKLNKKTIDAINYFVVDNHGMLNYKKLDGDIRDFVEEQKRAGGSLNKGGQKQAQTGAGGAGRKQKKAKKMKAEDLTLVMAAFKADIEKFISSKNVGIRYAFKRFDKDNDGFISLSEFEAALQDRKLLPFFENYEHIDGIVENLFDQFDEEKEMMINLHQFSKLLFADQANVDIAPLLAQFKSILRGKTEEDLRKEYSQIDANKDGQVSYQEFARYVKQITKGQVKDLESEKLFQHFQHDKSIDNISFEHFVAVVQDDHMNFEKIRTKIIEYKDKNSATLKSIYDKHSGANGSINLQSLQMFFQVLKLEFSMDQLDELFSFLDANGDGIISYEEFYQAIEKTDINYFQLLKRMRRDFIRAKCDVPAELKNRSSGRDVVQFGDFKDVISQFKIEMKPFELDALFRKYGRNDSIMYMDFLNDLLFNKYDIDNIRKKVVEYTLRENITLLQFFDFYSRNPDILILPEFHQLLLACELTIPKDEVLEAFSAFDMNNNGMINKMEFIQIMQGQMRPQANIGYNNMLQNAMNFVPVNYMESSLMMSTVHQFQPPNIYGNDNLAQSQFVQSNFFQQQQAQQRHAQGGPQQQQQQQQQQNVIFEEVNLAITCSVEEIIETIQQESRKRKIDILYFMTLLDSQLLCGFDKDDYFEEVFNALGIFAKGTHFDKLFKKFYVPEKKLCGYMNILKEIVGLRTLTQFSMLYFMRYHKMNIQTFFQKMVGKSARSLTIDNLNSFLTGSLNLIFPKLQNNNNINNNNNNNKSNNNNQNNYNNNRDNNNNINSNTTTELQILFKSIENPETQSIGLDDLAKFLSVTSQYDGNMDKLDTIDVIGVGQILIKMETSFKNSRLSAVDVFTAFDSQNSYKYSQQDLDQLLDSINMKLNRREVQSIMQQYSIQDSIQVLKIVSLIDEIPEIFKKVSLKVMSCNNLSFEAFFTHFSFDSKFSKWTISELREFFNTFNIPPSEKELVQLYNSICQRKSDIFPQELASFLQLRPNSSAQQTRSLQLNITDSIHDALTKNPTRQNHQQSFQQHNGTQQRNLFDIREEQSTQWSRPPIIQANSQFTPESLQFTRDPFSLHLQQQQQMQQQLFQQSVPQQQQQSRFQQQQQSNPNDFYQSRQSDQMGDYDRSISNNRQHWQDNQDQQLYQRRGNDNRYENEQHPPIPRNEQPIEDKMRLRKVIDQQYQLLATALYNKGGYEIINRSDRGMIRQDQFEQVLNKNYGFLMSPDFREFVSSLVDQSGYISVQEIFEKTNYDHSEFTAKSEINKQLGVTQNAGPRPPKRNGGIQDDQRIREIRSLLLKIYSNDFVALSETFFTTSALLEMPGFVSIATGIFQNSNLKATIPAAIAGPSGQQQQYQKRDSPTQQELEWLFSMIDGNGNGFVSYNEFEMYFVDDLDMIQKRKQNKFILTPEMEKDISDLFKIVDKNGDNQISSEELNFLFSKIGQQASQNEIDEYIRRYDKNGDRTIGFEEFKFIMQEKIMNEMLTAESVIDDLKREFKRVDLNNIQNLSIAQLGQVFTNMGANLKPSELSALFNEIDVDGSRGVDIDELVAFVTRNSTTTSPLAKTAILNIRLSRKFSIRDLLNTFKQMPANYRLSFIRTFNQKCLNLPSSTLRPKLTSSLIYSDLKYDKIQAIDPNLSVLDHSIAQNQFVLEFQIKCGTGIPLPDESSFPRQLIARRVAYITFYDSSRHIPIGNTTKIVATWVPEYEDRWTFESKQIDQTVLMKYLNYDRTRNQNICLCIELVMHYLPERSNSKCDLEISVSHVVIPFQNLNKPGENIFALSGGDPSRPVIIDPQDVRTKRTGFSNIVKALSKKIDSTLVVNIVTKIENRSLLSDLAIMPDIFVMRKSSLPLCAIYREYFGYRSIEKREIDQNLASDPIFKTFSKTMDCFDTQTAISDFWKMEVNQKIQSLKLLKDAFQKIMQQLYQLFMYERFNFSQQDPTASLYCFTSLTERQRLLGLCLEDIRIILNLKKGAATNLKISDSSIPFSIEELLDDNEEDDSIMIEEFINRKSKTSSIARR